MSDFFFERYQAIEEVKERLNLIASFYELGVPSIIDRVPSFTTSLLQVNTSGSNSSNDLGSKVTTANCAEELDFEFFGKYKKIIASLKEPYKDAITQIYINSKKLVELKKKNDHIDERLNEAYLQIAVLDDTIPYSISDYLAFRKYEQEQRAIKNTNKKEAIELIQLYCFNTSKANEMNRYTSEILELLPETDREELILYIHNQNNKRSAYQYRLVNRAILSFAFLHKKFEYSEADYVEDLRKTGGGCRQKWKRQCNGYCRISKPCRNSNSIWSY